MAPAFPIFFAALPSKVGEMAQTFISEIEGLTLETNKMSDCRQAGQQQYNIVPYGTEVFSQPISYERKSV